MSNDVIKKTTLIWAVIASLIIGFVGGAVYSSFKLSDQARPAADKAPAAPQQDDDEPDPQIASKVFQMEEYLKQNPNDSKAWAQLGNLFFDSNQYKNAIEAYGKSLAIDPNQTGVITDMGVMYRRNKQPEKAVESFDKAIALDPKFETARFNKGIVLLHDLNDMEGGLKAWEELVKINPLALAPNGESVDAILQRMKEMALKKE